jgi:CheY-like chemotaxis protein
MPAATIADRIAPHLPGLRRYARALSGAQASGDAHVAALLEALIADPEALAADAPPRVALYAAFQKLWESGAVEPGRAEHDPLDPAAERSAEARLRRLTPSSRQAVLLTAVEGFTADEAGRIMGRPVERVEELLSNGMTELRDQMRARILIIEDEPIIAMDIRATVEELGHEVVGVCDTREDAVRQATEERPDLVLADIQLADGSSGLEAVQDILGQVSVPVIFVTAYPERLLTARAPEPAFLISKPFQPGALQATVSQALFFEQAAAMA